MAKAKVLKILGRPDSTDRFCIVYSKIGLGLTVCFNGYEKVMLVDKATDLEVGNGAVLHAGDTASKVLQVLGKPQSEEKVSFQYKDNLVVGFSDGPPNQNVYCFVMGVFPKR